MSENGTFFPSMLWAALALPLCIPLGADARMSATGASWMQAKVKASQKAGISIVDSEFFEEPEEQPLAVSPSRAQTLATLSVDDTDGMERAQAPPARAPVEASHGRAANTSARRPLSMALAALQAPRRADQTGGLTSEPGESKSHSMQLLTHDAGKAGSGSSHYLSVRLHDASATASRIFGLVSEGVRAAGESAAPSWWHQAAAAKTNSSATSGQGLSNASDTSAKGGPAPGAMHFFASFPRVNSSDATKVPLKKSHSSMLALQAATAAVAQSDAAAAKQTSAPPRGPATPEELARKAAIDEARERERMEEMRIAAERERQQRQDEMMTKVRGDAW